MMSYTPISCLHFGLLLQLPQIPLTVLDGEGPSGIIIVGKETRSALYNEPEYFALCRLCKSGCDVEEVHDSTPADWSWYLTTRPFGHGMVAGYYYGSLL